METNANLRSLVALVLLLVPFLAGKFVATRTVFYIYSKNVYTLPIVVVVVVVVLQLYFIYFYHLSFPC